MPKRGTAEAVSDFVGSNVFLVGNCVWFAAWLVVNLRVIPGLEPFDPYPFGLLTMIVSLEAIVLSLFVLIAQNRGEKIDAKRDEIDLRIDLLTEREMTKLLQLFALLLEKQGIDTKGDTELQKMLHPTKISDLHKHRHRVMDAEELEDDAFDELDDMVGLDDDAEPVRPTPRSASSSR